MFGRAEGKRVEGLKMLISVAAIAAGMAATRGLPAPTPRTTEASRDVVGLWSWVADGSAEARSASKYIVEILRIGDGDLVVRRVWPPAAESGSRASIAAHATFDDGRVCVVGSDGVSFRGRLSEDGRSIEGKIQHSGGTAKASLRRVERKQLRTVSRVGSTT